MDKTYIDEINNTQKSIQLLIQLITENKADIGEDTESDYAKLRIEQNWALRYAIESLNKTIDCYEYTD